MAHIFELVNQLFAQVVPVADFLWDFPTNIDAYANIPILGQLSIAFLLLLGGSLYFTLRFGFVQVKEFKTGIRLLTSKQQAKVGTSQLAAFLVSDLAHRPYEFCDAPAAAEQVEPEGR